MHSINEQIYDKWYIYMQVSYMIINDFDSIAMKW